MTTSLAICGLVAAVLAFLGHLEHRAHVRRADAAREALAREAQRHEGRAVADALCARGVPPHGGLMSAESPPREEP